jgi:hypothetical protein
MAVSSLVAASSGGIKNVQRGSAGGAGTVTITAVNIAKAFVNVFGTASSGTVAASGTVGSHNSTFPQTTIGGTTVNDGQLSAVRWYKDSAPAVVSGLLQSTSIGTIPSATISNSSATISGGTTNLVAAVVQGYLSDSTSLVVSGACRWEVVEFN